MKDSPMLLSIAISEEELSKLYTQVENSVIKEINENPEKFFPFKPFNLKLYSTAEVARILCISEATVRNRCKDGSMSCIKPDGRNIMLTQEQLNEYIELSKVSRSDR